MLYILFNNKTSHNKKLYQEFGIAELYLCVFNVLVLVFQFGLHLLKHPLHLLDFLIFLIQQLFSGTVTRVIATSKTSL